MAVGKRVAALIVMALISTATPAIYQIGVEPRVAGARCNIKINSLELDQDYTTENMAIFKAYLRVENNEPVDVILSQLTLDVYHYSSSGRYELIGTLNTTRDYTVPGRGVIQSVKDEGVVTTIYPAENDRVPVVGRLALYQDRAGGSATTEAMADLISKGFVTLYTKGYADVGPFSFQFDSDHSLSLNFWDPNFVIEDVFPYLEESDADYDPEYTTGDQYEDSGVGKYVIHAKMHNPSGIPFVISDYNFSLVDNNDVVRARGIPLSTTLDSAYDPDVTQEESGGLTREVLSKVYKDGETATVFTTDSDEWQDVFFGVDFTDYDPDHYNPGAYLNPDQQDSLTRNNIHWFFNKLLTQPVLNDITLRGTLDMLIGYYDGNRAKGITVSVGSENPSEEQFNIFNVNFYQKHYNDYDGKTPLSIEEQMLPGKVELESVRIDSETDDITFNMSSVINFTNPYRFEISFSDFGTNYYRVDKNNVLNPLETFSFGSTEDVDLRSVTVDPATRTDDLSNPKLSDTITQIDHNFTMEFNTANYEGASGISKVLTDMNIDDSLVNWTDIFWLMSPKAGAMDVDPLVIMKNLISNGLDPLEHLADVEVKEALMTGGEAYWPLDAMWFGSRDDRSYWEMKSGTRPRGESGDLHPIDGSDPDSPSRPGYAYRYYVMNPVTVGSNWNAFTASGSRQWEMASRDPTVASSWTYDTSRSGVESDFVGLIAPGFEESGDRPASGGAYPDDTVWRIYSEQGDEPQDYLWGYWYDWYELLRNYYISYHPSAYQGGDPYGTDKGMAFCQDFELMDPSDPDAPTSLTADDVVSATMSISYRYPTGGASSGRFGLGRHRDLGGGNYNYDYSVLSGVEESTAYRMWKSSSSIYGKTLASDGSREWQSEVIDITSIIQQALSDYAGSGDPNDLKFELAFGVHQDTFNHVNFDDVQIQIDYKNPLPSEFEISSLFTRTEAIDEEDGNMWNLLSDIEFNATNFASFLGNDFGKGIGSEQPNLLSYLHGTDVDLSEMVNILDDEPGTIDGSEPISFLKMLNESRYIIRPGGESQGRVYVDDYGWRDEVGNYWVIEDPYKASKHLSDTLARTIRANSAGTRSPEHALDEELWLMFDNLGLYMPWVIMYLLGHGWSKDDVFDALEALGFASEVKQDWAGTDSNGLLTANLEILIGLEVLGGDGEMSDPEEGTFEFPMGQTVSDGYQELFRYLMDSGIPQEYGSGTNPYSVDDARTLVESGSIIDGLPSTEVEFDTTFDIEWEVFGIPITIPFDIAVTVQLTPKAFSLGMWMENLDTESKLVPTPINVDPADNPYLSGRYEGGQYYTEAYGLNDVGSKTLASLVRQNYLFAGEPFISSGGDPIGLFQFLDDYFFTTTEVTGGEEVDYSSFVVLDYFDVKSTDFIDLITGYNWETNKFDDMPDDYSGSSFIEANGRVDDWRAPLDYGYTWNDGSGSSAPWEGWGVDFWDGRIFWHPLNDSHWYNGHIIWSDSPSLLEINNAEPDRTIAHQQGEVYYQQLVEKDRPWEGAPPCVNLIDMLCWFSETLNLIDPDAILDWIIGELDSSYYDAVYPLEGGTGPEKWASVHNEGLGNQGTWGMLQNCTFNVTGMFNWLENVKKADPYKLMWELDDRSTGANESPDPRNLLEWSLNPNMVIEPTGHFKFMYHDALGSSIDQSQEILWNLYNASYWKEKGEDQLWDYIANSEETLPYLLFERFRDLELNGSNTIDSPYRNTDFNLFNIFISLNIDPISWWDLIQYTALDIKPLDVLFASNQLNLTQKIRQAGFQGKSSKLKINGSLNLGVYGLPLTFGANWQLGLNYTIDPTLFTASYHWSEFIDSDALYRDTFIIS